MIQPIRPKRNDFVSDELYQQARESYKQNKEKYNSELNKYANDVYNQTSNISDSQIQKWAQDNNVKLGDNYTEIDNKILNLYIKEHEKLMQVQKMFEAFGNNFDKNGIFEAEATHGITFGKGSANGIDFLIQNIKNANGINFVNGSNTINNLFDHEFGHNVFEAMKWQTDSRITLENDFVKAVYGKTGMSEYATTNADELFAEGFCAWFNGEKKLILLSLLENS